MEQKKFNRNKRRRYGKGFRRAIKPEKKSPVAQFEHLFGIYLHARKKFFDKFDPENPKASIGLENSYYEALERLRVFEKGLTPEQASKIHAELKIETTYSSNRGISYEGAPYDGQAEDPHFLKIQENADFKSDTEESVGTYEDYKAYKGL